MAFVIGRALVPRGNKPSIRLIDTNPYEALVRRRKMATLTWRGPAVMLFARTVLAVVAQGVVAIILALRGWPSPWHDAEAWLPVYGTLIDAGCLALLWRLTRHEGIALFDLIGFERSRLGRDTLLGLAIIPVSLVFILGGSYMAGWIVYGSANAPRLLGDLPLAAVFYGVLVFPLIWGLTEQMTYNGYLLKRLQVLSRRTSVAVVVVAFFWAMQHAFMPLTLDPDYMAFRFLASVPHSVFVVLLYLRLRRLVPIAAAHALMDGASVLVPAL